MDFLNIKNPFAAPVYHEEILSSTFDAARGLPCDAAPHGTVVTADFQESGRGRGGRPWAAERGKNLLFTILLRYESISSIPQALTLKTGLAVSLAMEGFFPVLTGLVKIKWPNDIMLASRKAAGILTESDGKNVYIGVGVNVGQREFPEEYRAKAGSFAQVLPELYQDPEGIRFVLLEKILRHLYDELETGVFWRERLEPRLYKRGETVTFIEGAAGSGQPVRGTLSGIGSGGELLITPEGEKKERAFVTGELLVY